MNEKEIYEDLQMIGKSLAMGRDDDYDQYKADIRMELHNAYARGKVSKEAQIFQQLEAAYQAHYPNGEHLTKNSWALIRSVLKADP